MPTAPLARVVRGFVADWNRTRPPSQTTLGGAGGGRRAGSIDQVRPLEWLAAEAHLSVSRVEHIHRNSYPRTELWVAEALIVGALERPDLFHDGTLPIEPNPLAKPAARDACCGGSTGDPGALTGVA